VLIEDKKIKGITLEETIKGMTKEELER